ncbi:hypothetical protein AY599_02100 [Leptolyngbya valderiana BDU 20041]|nr:hypothetical protein [Geitlerinema sp. CS-897]OAB61855.1 hypothetical protein AY599_02100 [Leptolyngbya valderiana BDU 20041]PPT05844.1 hypothetical protein CKA32_004904 [Geitlerinema sp. FC II]
MNESEMQSFIWQHSESARPFADRAFRLGNSYYIFPEPNFSQEAQELVRYLIVASESWQRRIVDFKVFRKPRRNRQLSKELIRKSGIRALFEFAKTSYSGHQKILEGYWDVLDKGYWDEIDIYRNAKTMSQDRFEFWLIDYLLTNPDDTVEQDETLKKSHLDVILDELFPLLGSTIDRYCMVDANDENCPFAPYFFIGASVLIMIAVEWEL